MKDWEFQFHGTFVRKNFNPASTFFGIVKIKVNVRIDPIQLRETVIKALSATLNSRPLDSELNGLARDMYSGVLRTRGRLDWIIDQQLRGKRPGGRVRKSLWLGVYQLLYQENAYVSQVVNETVEFVKKKEGIISARFVNAILRKISSRLSDWKEWGEDRENAETSGKWPVSRPWTSLPDWIWRRVDSRFGRSRALDFAEFSIQRPGIWIRLKRGRFLDEPGWEPASKFEAPLTDAWFHEAPGEISKIPGFLEGDFYVQDVTSQILVNRVTKFIRNQFGEERPKVLDYCAAPGGKSVGLAWNGIEVSCFDSSAKRLELLAENILRLKLSEKIKTFVEREDIPKGHFDLVWIDAPCTGTGTLRAAPEIRWIKNEKDLASLLKAQETIVKDALVYLKKGGFLVYSVCSVLPEEADSNRLIPGFSISESDCLFGPGDGFQYFIGKV